MGEGRDTGAWSTVVLILVMFILATVYPVTKGLTGSVHPVTVSLFRYGLGTLAMLPLYLAERRRRPRVAAGDLLGLCLLGALGIALFSVCLSLGVHYSTASSGSLLVNSQPVFTTLLAPVILREELTPLRLLGALGGMVGVYLVVSGHGAPQGVLGERYLVGNLILVGAAVSFSLYTMLLKPYVLRYGGLIPTFLSMLAGSVLLLPAAFAAAGGRPLSGLDGPRFLLLAYIGVVGTALVYPVFHRVMGAAGVVRAVAFKLLIPVFGIALSMLLLAERPGWRTALGAAAVVGAVGAIQMDRARQPGVITSLKGGRP